MTYERCYTHGVAPVYRNTTPTTPAQTMACGPAGVALRLGLGLGLGLGLAPHRPARMPYFATVACVAHGQSCITSAYLAMTLRLPIHPVLVYLDSEE